MPTVADASQMNEISGHVGTNPITLEPQPDSGFTLPPGWSILQVYDETPTDGDYGVAYVNTGLHEVYYASRGTVPGNLQDIKSDIKIAANGGPKLRIADAEANVKALIKNHPDSVVTSGGHSLGGFIQAKVSMDLAKNGTTLYVLVEDAPNNYLPTTHDDQNVLSVRSRWDLVSSDGDAYHNDIVLDGPAGQFGSGGSHSLAQLRDKISQNSPLSNLRLGQKFDPESIKTGGGVTNISIKDMSSNSSSNTSDSKGTLSEDSSGNLTETVIRTNSENHGIQISRINVHSKQTTAIDINLSPGGGILQSVQGTIAVTDPSDPSIVTSTKAVIYSDGKTFSSSDNSTVGRDQFQSSSDFNTLGKISNASGVPLDQLTAANPQQSPTGPITNGTLINLPPPDNSHSPTVTVNANPSPQTGTQNENNTSNNTNGGFSENSGTASVKYNNDELNKRDAAAVAQAALGTGNVRPGEIQGNFNVFFGPALNMPLPGSYAAAAPQATHDGFIIKIGNQTMSYNFNQYVDPLLLDLTGNGIGTSSNASAPLLFDIDHSGTLKTTGWANLTTGILAVADANGKVTNMSQLFSEYYRGTAGTGGAAGAKPFINGFGALGYEDTNFDGQITSADTVWSKLRVWVDANHDGVSDSGELKTMAQLGITQISTRNSFSTAIDNGNPITATSTFTMNGVAHKIADVNLISDTASHSFAASGTGKIDTVKATDKTTGTTSTVTNYIELATTGKSLNATSLHVNNVIGGDGNDTLIAAADGSWLTGMGGSNIYQGGAGNDTLVVSASDDPTNIHGGGGQDILVITGTTGMTIDMAQTGIEIAEGGAGDDVIMSGGRTGVYMKGGSGNSLLIGGAGTDVINGGTGHNTIIGGTGQALIYAGPNGDLIYGAAGNSIINAGGGEDTIIAGAGDDLIKVGMGNANIDGGGGTNLAQFHGSYGDYKIVKTADGYWIADKTANRDGTVFIKNIQKLNFSDVQALSLTLPNPVPVADIITKDKSGLLLDRAHAHTISAVSLLGNDQMLGSTGPLKIKALKEVVGGTASITASGDVLFTPAAGFQGIMSFKYTVVDAQNHAAATATDLTTGQSAAMYARVTLSTPDLPTDPLLSQEWYLNDTNVIPVWQDYTGKGVRIGQFEPGGEFAVAPEILNYNHPDLAPNIDAAWLETQQMTGILPNHYSDHATMVAGIMVAANNGAGAVGIAYNATIGAHYIDNVSTLQNLDNMESYDITNNSWAIVPDFSSSNLNLTDTLNPEALYQANQQYAALFGRGTDGTISISAAGNDRATGGSAQGSFLNNSRYAIEVGAINQPADLSTLALPSTPFSSPGASILVSAPGSNMTSSSQVIVTDQGSIFGNTYSTLAGTSFATPIVSGIAALMLQANPNLTYRDVQAILAMSAKKITDTTTTWNTNGAHNWNGGGMHESYDYGFGEVDALAATRLAETWIPHNTGISEQQVSATSTTVVSLKAGSSNTQSLTVAAGIKVEHVEVDLNLTYGHLKDVTAILISPNGTQSILLKANGPENPSTSLQYTFMSTQEWGESSGGTWQLQLQDASTGQVLKSSGWSLRLYGSTATADDIYYYTNEYAASATSARTLNDAVNGAAGGKNTINAAAITGNSSINLLTGAASLGGTPLTIQNPTNFNNIFTGDGNDTLVGNNNAGILDGGRGNNTLTGGTGQNLFVIQEKATGQDILTNVSVAQGDKVDLVGFNGLSYSKLTFTQQSTDVLVGGLGTAQSILLKNLTKAAISSALFTFQDTFVAPAAYTDSGSSNSAVLTGISTINLTGSSTNPSVDAAPNQEITVSLHGAVNHDLATSDRFVVNLQAAGTDDYHNDLQGFKPGIDKIDLSKLGIQDSSDLYIFPYDRVALADTNPQDAPVRISHGVYICSISLGVTTGYDTALVYLEAIDASQLKASDFIFANGQAGDPNGQMTTVPFVPNNNVPTNSNGNTDPTFIGSNAGITFTTDSVQSSVNYVLPDTLNKLVLTGTHNLIGTGNNNGDTITGNSGLDTLIGGTGNDTYIVNSTDTVIVENVSAGNDTVQSNVDYEIGENIENLTLIGANALIASGNALNNVITGNALNNILYGLAGNDTLNGGAGNDIYVFDPGFGTDSIIDASGTDRLDFSGFATNLNISLAAGTFTQSTGNKVTWTGSTIENLTTGSGNDTLTGSVGINALTGGEGNDVYYIDTSTDQINEYDSEGTDSVFASVKYTLSNNVENLTLTGTVALAGTGNNLNNILTGSSGNDTLTGMDGDDTLIGGIGNDRLVGGLGNDVYFLDSTADVVSEATNQGTDTVNIGLTYTLGSNVENLILTGTNSVNGFGNTLDNALTGNSGANSLSGSAGNDTLQGLAGNDSLDGGAGSDSLIGGLGNDLYTVDSTGDVIVENLSEGTDSVNASITYTLGSNVENLTLTGTSALSGTGNELANQITGNAGNNLLTGAAGNDTLTGGAGNDTLDGGLGNDSLVGGLGNDLYWVDSATDTILENAAEGTDTVQASVTYTLSANIEKLTLTGTSGINGTGNVSDNLLTGNSVNNILDGGAGNDTLIGGTGNDTLKGNTGNDLYQFHLGDGVDSLQENDSTAGNLDIVSLDSSIAKAKIAVYQSGTDLQFGYIGSTDQITVKGQTTTTGSVEKFTLSDGSFMTAADINAVISSMASYASSHGITISNLSTVEGNTGLIAIVNAGWHK